MPLGWWVGFEISDDAVFSRIVSGELTMMSIGGYSETQEITSATHMAEMEIPV